MNTRQLCRAVAAALRAADVERHAARLLRDGYLPRAAEDVDAWDAAILMSAVAVSGPEGVARAVDTLASLPLRWMQEAPCGLAGVGQHCAGVGETLARHTRNLAEYHAGCAALLPPVR